MAVHRGTRADSGTYDDAVLGPYAELSHKPPFAAELPELWDEKPHVPTRDIDRFAAYRILYAYLRNNARRVINHADGKNPRNRREYGDPSLYTSRAASGVLGTEGPSLVLPELVTATAPAPDLTNRPDVDQLPDDASPTQRRIAQAEVAVWDEMKEAEAEEWLAAVDLLPRLRGWFRYLTEWSRAERAIAKFTQQETEHTIPLGDAVEVYSWSTDTGRVALDIYPPDVWFTDESDDHTGFPQVVHLVWEEQHPNPKKYDNDNTQVMIRRLTWERERLVDDNDNTQPRQYPYAAEPSEFGVYMSNILFDPEEVSKKMKRAGIRDHKADVTKWPNAWGDAGQSEDGTVLDRTDIGMDFIPVILKTNTVAEASWRFGQSLLMRSAQTFDDIAATDSDVQSAVGLAAVPALAVSGVSPPTEDDSGRIMGQTVEVEPGAILYLGAEGSAEAIDMTASVEIANKTSDRIRGIASEITEIPETVLGRNNLEELPSGRALIESRVPFDQLIARLRLARFEKYALGLKFVQRIAILHDPSVAAFGFPVRAEWEFGAYVPSNVEDAITQAGRLRESGAGSIETAVRIVKGAGVETGTVEEETRRIVAQDTEAALQAADATGSAQIAADRLDVVIDRPDGATATPAAVPAPAPQPDDDVDDDDGGPPTINLG